MGAISGETVYLSGTSDTKGRNQSICAMAAMGSQDTFDQRRDARGVEDIELGGILFENLGEGEFLGRTLAVIRRVEGNVCRMGAVCWLFNAQESVRGCSSSRGRPQSQVDLEEVRGRLV